MLAGGLLDQGLELLVDHLPQLDPVSVSLVEINSTEYTFLVRLLQLVQQDQGRGRRDSLVLVVLRLPEVGEVCGPVPGQEQVQQLSGGILSAGLSHGLVLPEVEEAHDEDALLHAGDGLTAGEHLALDQVQVHLLQSSVRDRLDVLVQQEVDDGPGEVLAAAHTGHARQPAGQVGEALKY